LIDGEQIDRLELDEILPGPQTGSSVDRNPGGFGLALQGFRDVAPRTAGRSEAQVELIGTSGDVEGRPARLGFGNHTLDIDRNA
jgi:hypothetical protein